MSRSLPAICLLDPLSMAGRELLQLMEERQLRPERVLGLHLGAEDEQHVAELLGEPALVQPLDRPQQVPEEMPVVIAGQPSQERRPVLEALLAERLTQAVLDLAGTGILDGPIFAGAPGKPPRPPRAVVASPGAAMVAGLVRPIAGLGLESVSAVVEVPASAFGTEAVESLAHQAAARLQGLPPDGTGEAGPALAFDLMPGGPGRTAADLAQLLPGAEIAASEVRVGTFHGWIVHLALRFTGAVAAERLQELWEATGTIKVEGAGFRLLGVVESDRIHLGPVAVSGSGRQVVVTAGADGLRVGGAATALEILTALI